MKTFLSGIQKAQIMGKYERAILSLLKTTFLQKKVHYYAIKKASFNIFFALFYRSL